MLRTKPPRSVLTLRVSIPDAKVGRAGLSFPLYAASQCPWRSVGWFGLQTLPPAKLR